MIVAGALLAPACERDKARGPAAAPPPAAAPAGDADSGTVRMQIGKQSFTLEVAATPKSQQLGLMHRQSMPADRGMIFVFPQERYLSFWMKNTLIALDIVYLDKDGKVVSVRQMKPLDETPVPSGAPAKYAIELNQGTAGRVGVKAGDVLIVPAGARD
jgi:uncharacterized membrane protein (UPF0127 family)